MEHEIKSLNGDILGIEELEKRIELGVLLPPSENSLAYCVVNIIKCEEYQPPN